MKEMTAIDDSIRQLVTIKDENDNLISAFNTSDKCYITADIVDGEVSWRTSDETPTSTVADRVEQDRMNFSSLLGDNTVSNYIRTRDSGVNEITYTRNGKVHKEVDLASIPKRNKKVDVPTEQWQKSVERKNKDQERQINLLWDVVFELTTGLDRSTNKDYENLVMQNAAKARGIMSSRFK